MAHIESEAQEILAKWLVKHGHPTPAFLKSRYLQAEYLIDSAKFKGKDARTELDYDEVSSGSESGSDYGDENDDESNGSSELETSPEPVHSIDSLSVE